MPKFVYSLGFFNFLTLGGIILLIVNKSPFEKYVLLIFLLLCFIFFFLGISLIFFLLHAKKTPLLLTDSRKVYRKGIRTSLLMSFVITGIIGLKIYALLSFITGFLLIAFGLSILGISAVNRRYK
jgi:hypothetical protein